MGSWPSGVVALSTASRIGSAYCGPYSAWPCAQLLPEPLTSVMYWCDSNSSPIGERSVSATGPSSMSTRTARARSAEIGEPSPRSRGGITRASTLRKNADMAAS